MVSVVAAVGGTVFVGKTLETKMVTESKVALEKFAPFVRVKSFSYDKSVLGATRTIGLEFGCNNKPLQVTWRDQIKHGPFPGFEGVGAATIDSELIPSDAAKAELKATLGLDLPAIRARSVVALNGDIVTDATLPALSAKLPDGTQFFVQAITSKFVYSGATVNYDYALPGIELREPRQGSVTKLTAIKFKGVGTTGKFWWLSTGSSTSEIGKIEMTAKQGDKELTVLASNLLTMSTSKLDGDLISASSDMKGQFEFDKVKLENVQMVSGMKRLHAPTLDAMMSAVFSQNSAALLCGSFGKTENKEALQKQFAKQLFDMVRENALKLLPFNPEFSMDKVAAIYLGIEGGGSYSVGVQGFTAEDAQSFKDSPMAIIKKLELAANLKLPVPWIQSMVASTAGADKALDDAAFAQMVEPMIQRGLFVREGDLLTLKAEMKDGQANLNGKKIPIPGM